jgi:hypothetical protein
MQRICATIAIIEKANPRWLVHASIKISHITLMASAKTATLLNIISKEKKRMRIRQRKTIQRTKKLNLKNQTRPNLLVITNRILPNHKT